MESAQAPLVKTRAFHLIEAGKLYCVTMSPECRAFSTLMEGNRFRMDPDKLSEVERSGIRQLVFCVRVAAHQIRTGGIFVIEHPVFASSWLTQVMV